MSVGLLIKGPGTKIRAHAFAVSMNAWLLIRRNRVPSYVSNSSLNFYPLIHWIEIAVNSRVTSKLLFKNFGLPQPI